MLIFSLPKCFSASKRLWLWHNIRIFLTEWSPSFAKGKTWSNCNRYLEPQRRPVFRLLKLHDASSRFKTILLTKIGMVSSEWESVSNFSTSTPGAYLRNQLSVRDVSTDEFVERMRVVGVKFRTKTIQKSSLWNVSSRDWFFICEILQIPEDAFKYAHCLTCTNLNFLRLKSNSFGPASESTNVNNTMLEKYRV